MGSTTTGDIVYTVSNPGAILLSAVEVRGLARNIFASLGGSAFGALTTPDTGAFGTGTTNYYCQQNFMMSSLGGAGSWVLPFTGGGQDVSACSPYVLTEGYVIGSAGILDARLSGILPNAWVATGAIYV